MIIEYYKSMSQNQKVLFWQIVTNLFLVVFTFWMGLFVQDFIADKNAKSSVKLTRIEYVDKVLPVYRELNDLDVLSEFRKLVSLKEFSETKSEVLDNVVDKKAQELLINYKNEIIDAAIKNAMIMSRFKWYLSENMRDSVSNNNLQILIPVKTLDIIDKVDLSSCSDDELRQNFLDYVASSDFVSAVKSSNKIYESSESFVELCRKVTPASEVILVSQIMVGMVKNLMILENSITEDTSNQVSFRKEPWIVLLLSCVIIIFITSIFAKFIAPKTVNSYVSKSDYEKLESKFKSKEQECLNLSASLEAMLARVESLKKTIEIKDDIIADDIRELNKFRNNKSNQ